MRVLLVVFSILLPLALHSNNYVKGGLELVTQEFLPTVDGSVGTPTLITESFEINPETGSLELYRSSDKNEKYLAGFIESDGDKVYYKFPDDSDSESYLLYDFGLLPGEGCYVYSILADSYIIKRYVECTSVGMSENGKLTIMFMKCLASNSELTWIKGLSSMRGFTTSLCSSVDGGPGYRLIEAKDEAEVIYSVGSADVPDIAYSSISEIKVEGGCLYVTGRQNTLCSLFSESGIHLGEYIIGDATLRIPLPQKGIYILRIGDESHKIIL